MNMITEDILKMLFEEYGESYEAWVASSGYAADWSDRRIYDALPGDLQALLGDFGINASWMHHGM